MSSLFSQTGFEFDRWLNTPGWPPYLPDLSPGDSLMKPAEELAQLWVAKELDMKAIEAVAISTWKTYQLVYFLDQILQKLPLPPGKERGCFLLRVIRVPVCRAGCQRPEETREKPLWRPPRGLPGVREGGSGQSSRRRMGVIHANALGTEQKA